MVQAISMCWNNGILWRGFSDGNDTESILCVNCPRESLWGCEAVNWEVEESTQLEASVDYREASVDYRLRSLGTFCSKLKNMWISDSRIVTFSYEL
jgi:hypothetical protein